jgi:hypothetical protein
MKASRKFARAYFPCNALTRLGFLGEDEARCM